MSFVNRRNLSSSSIDDYEIELRAPGDEDEFLSPESGSGGEEEGSWDNGGIADSSNITSERNDDVSTEEVSSELSHDEGIHMEIKDDSNNTIEEEKLKPEVLDTSEQKFSNIDNLLRTRKISHLMIPYYYGFKRRTEETLDKNNESLVRICYEATDGTVLTCLREVHEYLLSTNLEIPISMFSFEENVRPCLTSELDMWKDMVYKLDLSEGQERIPIPVICSKQRQPGRLANYLSTSKLADEVQLKIPLVHDDEFLVCCDCADDCRDKLNCACFLTTLENCSKKTRDACGDLDIGYNYKLLKRSNLSGIFECNRRCKCRNTCFNRVAQNGIYCRLQLFMTDRKGWGVRTLCDIPKGTFISNYTGIIVSGEYADRVSKSWHDGKWKYLSSLSPGEEDKEGYEATAIEPEIPPSKILPEEHENNQADDGSPDKCEFVRCDDYLKKLVEVELKGISSVESSSTYEQLPENAIEKSLCDPLSPMSEEGWKNFVKESSVSSTPARLSSVEDNGSTQSDEMECQRSPSPCTSTSTLISGFNIVSDLESSMASPVQVEEPRNSENCTSTPVIKNRQLRSWECEVEGSLLSSVPDTCRFGTWKPLTNAEYRHIGNVIKISQLKSRVVLQKGSRTEKWTRAHMFCNYPPPETNDNHNEPSKPRTKELLIQSSRISRDVINGVVEKIKQGPTHHVSVSSIRTPRLYKKEVSLQGQLPPAVLPSKKLGRFANKTMNNAKIPMGPLKQVSARSRRQTGVRKRARKCVSRKKQSVILREMLHFHLNIDGLDAGNIGRYFNHSCNPNIFPQFVFIDSHDLRLPNISFFAARSINAGEELTWNYKYDPEAEDTQTQDNEQDVMQPKKRKRKTSIRMQCFCGQDNCSNKIC